jgi:RNA polymerase sigma-70 factor, ECF subfamily
MNGNGGSVAIPMRQGEWSGKEDPLVIGVRAGSFVPFLKEKRSSMTENQDITKLTTDILRGMDDEALITTFQAGDKDVYRILVERYQERIRNLLFSIFRDRNFIDDLAQEVFIKAFQALPHFRFESTFYTWLYRIAVNKSRDELRKKKVRRFFSFQPLDEGFDHELSSRLSVPPIERDAKEIVELGLQTLPEKFRTAVILKDIDGLSYEEIAEVMQCELGTVKSRISRARAMLKKSLKPLLEEVKS